MQTPFQSRPRCVDTSVGRFRYNISSHVSWDWDQSSPWKLCITSEKTLFDNLVVPATSFVPFKSFLGLSKASSIILSLFLVCWSQNYLLCLAEQAPLHFMPTSLFPVPPASLLFFACLYTLSGVLLNSIFSGPSPVPWRTNSCDIYDLSWYQKYQYSFVMFLSLTQFSLLFTLSSSLSGWDHFFPTFFSVSHIYLYHQGSCGHPFLPVL